MRWFLLGLSGDFKIKQFDLKVPTKKISSFMCKWHSWANWVVETLRNYRLCDLYIYQHLTYEYIYKRKPEIFVGTLQTVVGISFIVNFGSLARTKNFPSNTSSEHHQIVDEHFARNGSNVVQNRFVNRVIAFTLIYTYLSRGVDEI